MRALSYLEINTFCILIILLLFRCHRGNGDTPCISVPRKLRRSPTMRRRRTTVRTTHPVNRMMNPIRSLTTTTIQILQEGCSWIVRVMAPPTGAWSGCTGEPSRFTVRHKRPCRTMTSLSLIFTALAPR